MMTKSECISAFLKLKTHADLAASYNRSMEVQVNVIKTGGKPIDAGELEGRGYKAYTDGINTWKPLRIPFKAKTEPVDNDTRMQYSLEAYAEGIGMTGWDWENKVSRWVAYDFDAILGHSDRHGRKLTDVQLQEIQDIVKAVPFVTLRRSTSGKGLHLYVYLEPVVTNNHTEHAALARSILAMLSGLCGYDFANKVDICGGNMWVWHRKMYDPDGRPNLGLQLLKSGERLRKVPNNWRDHMMVARREQSRVTPAFIEGNAEDEMFADLTSQRSSVTLDAGHRALIEWLAENNCMWEWQQDSHMLITHTYHLKEAHTALKMCGDFHTSAIGSERGSDQNCFAFPLRDSGWAIRRFTPGVSEHESWEQDGAGWTRCFLNRKPDFMSVTRLNGGVEAEKGGYHFRHAEQAQTVLLAFGIDLKLPSFVLSRKAVLKPTRESKLVIHIDSETTDDATKMKGWLNEKKLWRRVVTLRIPSNSEAEGVKNYEDIIRHVIANETDAGWVVRRENVWCEEPLVHVKAALTGLGEDAKDINQIVGSSMLRVWTLVNKPFQPEYPGNREWNRNAAQLAVAPTLDTENLTYPHWMKIMNHLGSNLTAAVLEDAWCRDVGITTGAEFLMLWIATLIRKPDQPMTYLSFYGDQDCGKSIFHEAIGEILLTKGVVRADNALQSTSNFNGELENCVLAVVEETDLSKNKTAYNRIKDWVTSPYIMIRPLFCQGYMVANCTHWVQTSNEPEATPVLYGDSRITMVHVPKLREMIPKLELKAQLRKEAPDFLAALLIMDLPTSNSRLAVPTVETEAKKKAMDKNATLLEQFMKAKMFEVPGHSVAAEEIYNEMQLWLDDKDKSSWSGNKIGRMMPDRFPKGRIHGGNQQTHYGNLTFDETAKPDGCFVQENKIYILREVNRVEKDSGDRPPEVRG